MQQFTLRGGNTASLYPARRRPCHPAQQAKVCILPPYPFHEEDLEREIDDGKFTNY